MSMKKQELGISGKVVRTDKKRGVEGVRVEAWLLLANPNVRLAKGETVKGGDFSLRLDRSQLESRLPVSSGVEPVIYFKVLDDTGLLANTKRDLHWTPKSGPDPVIIQLREGRSAQDELLEKLPPTLREEIESLRKYDDQILSALQDEATRAVFLRDPGAVLRRLDLPLSSVLNKRLKKSTGGEELLRERRFRLPDGRIITPKINIRFTK